MGGAGAVWHYLFAAQLPGEGISISPQDLLLPASADAEFIAVPIVATGGVWPAVKVGADVQLVSAKAPLTVATPSDSASESGVVPFVYYVLAPRLHSGFAIVGEPAKAVPASRQRICSMSGDLDLQVELCGVAGEEVRLAYIAPNSTTLAETKCVLNSKGRAVATCAVQQCACGSIAII